MADDLVLICGEEPFLIDASARQWRRRADGAQLTVEIFDQPAKLAPLERSLAEMPMFDPERVIIVRDPPQLTGQARKGADSAEALGAALANRADTTAVCIINHGTVAPGNPVRAAVKNLGGEIIEHPRLKGRDLRGFADGAARERGLRLEGRSIEHVMATAGPDLGMIAGEFDKLAAFADGEAITHDDVLSLVAGDSQVEIWNVIEWLLGPAPGKGAAAVDTLLADGRAPIYIMATLAGQIRELVQVRALLSERKAAPASIAGTLRLPPWRADRLVRQAKILPGRVGVAWLKELQRLDTATKAGDVDDHDAVRGFMRSAAAEVVALRT